MIYVAYRYCNLPRETIDMLQIGCMSTNKEIVDIFIDAHQDCPEWEFAEVEDGEEFPQF